MRTVMPRSAISGIYIFRKDLNWMLNDIHNITNWIHVNDIIF